MRIALVKRRYSLRHGGSERYCVNLARSLKARGHEMSVIGESIDDDLAGEVDFRPVHVNRFSSWTNNRSFADNAGRIASSGGFDLVYGLGRAGGLDAVRVTERLQPHWLRVKYRHPLRWAWERINPRHRTLINLERAIYHSPATRRIVVQSHLDRQLIQRYYGVGDEKLRVVHNGVDTGVFHPGVRTAANEIRAAWSIDRDVPLLLFASMDFDGKGLRYIIEALSRIRSRDARLLVLGDGPVPKFQAVADNAGVGERIIFAGRQDGIERFYGAADLFLLPTAYEPFPNVNLEAMACGTAALTTRTAGGADVVIDGETGYLIDEMTAVDQLVDCIDRHLALSETERRQMASRCWEVAREMTIEKNVEKTLDVFDEVLREKFRA